MGVGGHDAVRGIRRQGPARSAQPLFPGLISSEGTSWQVTAFLDDGFAAGDVADGSGAGRAKTLIAGELTMCQSAPTFFVTAP